MGDISLVTIVFTQFHSSIFISLIRNKREKRSLEMLVFLFTIHNTLIDGRHFYCFCTYNEEISLLLIIKYYEFKEMELNFVTKKLINYM